MTRQQPAAGSHLERLRSQIDQRRDPNARLELDAGNGFGIRLRKADYDSDLKAQRQVAAAVDDGEKRLAALAHFIAKFTEAVGPVDSSGKVLPLYEDGADAALDERLAEAVGAPWISAPDLLRHVFGEGPLDEIAGELSAWSIPGGVKTLQGESTATRR